jgi:hypothetical protein
MYNTLFRLLKWFFIGWIIMAVAIIFVSLTNASSWKANWIFFQFGEGFFFVGAVVVAWLWAPGESSFRYAWYSQPVGGLADSDPDAAAAAGLGGALGIVEAGQGASQHDGSTESDDSDVEITFGDVIGSGGVEGETHGGGGGSDDDNVGIEMTEAHSRAFGGVGDSDSDGGDSSPLATPSSVADTKVQPSPPPPPATAAAAAAVLAAGRSPSSEEDGAGSERQQLRV